MKMIVMRPAFAVFLLAAWLSGLSLTISPAKAATSPWVDSVGGRIRILADAPGQHGTIRGAVQIDLKPGWVTYWRNPGESGVPPKLTTTGSSNLKSAVLAFPPPVTFDEGGITAIGYNAPVTLPLTLKQQTPGRPSRLDAQVFIGVCKQICVPVSASYTLDIPVTGTSESGIASMTIDEAYASLPRPEDPRFTVLDASLDKTRKSIAVKVRLPPSTIDRPSLFVDGPADWSFGSARLAGIEGNTANFVVPVTGKPENDDTGGRFIFVVRAGPNSMKATRTIR